MRRLRRIHFGDGAGGPVELKSLELEAENGGQPCDGDGTRGVFFGAGGRADAVGACEALGCEVGAKRVFERSHVRDLLQVKGEEEKHERDGIERLGCGGVSRVSESDGVLHLAFEKVVCV